MGKVLFVLLLLGTVFTSSILAGVGPRIFSGRVISFDREFVTLRGENKNSVRIRRVHFLDQDLRPGKDVRVIVDSQEMLNRKK